MQKFNPFRSPKLLQSAKGQECRNCGIDDGTIVSAHSNQSIHGKGKSIKASDVFIAWLCFNCHSWLDQGTGLDPTGIWTAFDGKEEMWRQAHDKTLEALFKNGAVVVK